MSVVLEARNLAKTYDTGGSKVLALRGVDLHVQRGEFVAIRGPSGCGKSTLLNLLAGLDRPTAGEVWLDGERIDELGETRLAHLRRRKIGFVFQRFNLFPTLTAEGNLKLAERIHTNGKPGMDAAARREILRLLRLENKMHHKPLELSGGEQQRVAIARAIINRPSIILADEPTGNLDTENSTIVLDMLRELNREFKQTIVIITHNPEAAAVASRTVEMRDGMILRERRNGGQ